METMTVHKGIKLRCYPNQKQRNTLEQMFGNERFLWNKMLETINKRYKNNKSLPPLSSYDMAYLLKPFKKENPFLKMSDSTGLQMVCKNLSQSWKNFFKDKTHKVGKPVFHSRKFPRKSCSGGVYAHILKNRYMFIPKLKTMKTSSVRRLKHYRIKNYTITLEPTGKYYLSLTVEYDNQAPRKKTGKSVGIDLGIADLAISSDGVKYGTFRNSFIEHKIKEWQSKFSRRKHLANVKVASDKHKKVLVPRELEDFSNWQLARVQKAHYQKQLADKRHYYLHHLTTMLVNKYDKIAIEDLRASNMLKNHHLANSISNAAWRMFRTLLEYKCKFYGKELVVVNPKNTSRICSNCGFNSGEKPLEVREWTCPKCHMHHDRDINAAVNILNTAKANG